MKLQKLLSYTRKAIDDYDMIQSGDKIAIGISGGKDSLTLLYAMHNLMRFYPKSFRLAAITVDLGYPDFHLDKIEALCREMQIPYYVVKTEIGKIVFEKKHEDNPCFLCARLRKGALNQKALELGCNKIAYAHHKDDILETMLLSMIFEGRFYAFSPKTYLERTKLTVIRPMMYVAEADVIGFMHKQALPVSKNPCPVDGATKRQYAKNLLQQINRDNPGAKDRMFTAILNGNIEGWPLRQQRKSEHP